MKLSGNVKQLTELKFSQKRPPNKKQGNNTEFELSEKQITKFNSEGNIVEAQTIYSNLSGSMNYLNLNLNKTIYIYNKDGFLLTFYNTIDTLKEKRFEYDKRGNLTKVQWFSNSIALNEKHLYKYDQLNQLIEETDWDTSAVPVIRKTFSYDNKGNKRESTVYKRNITGQLAFNSKNNYSYDSIGRIIESISFYRNEPAIKSKFTLDNYGNNILISRFNSRGVITDKDSLTYQYDFNMNWIKRMNYSVFIVHAEPILMEINQRIIEYY